jgi:hypothetical protein
MLLPLGSGICEKTPQGTCKAIHKKPSAYSCRFLAFSCSSPTLRTEFNAAHDRGQVSREL